MEEDMVRKSEEVLFYTCDNDSSVYMIESRTHCIIDKYQCRDG